MTATLGTRPNGTSVTAMPLGRVNSRFSGRRKSFGRAHRRRRLLLGGGGQRGASETAAASSQVVVVGMGFASLSDFGSGTTSVGGVGRPAAARPAGTTVRIVRLVGAS